MKSRNLLIIIGGAILVAALALFIRTIQYEPLYPNYDKIEAELKNDVPLTFIPIYAEDPVVGDKKAAKTIVVFEDFGCERCKEQEIILNSLIQQYPKKLKLIIKALPVTKFPFSTEMAHDYAYCANRQGKYTLFAAAAFANNQELSEITLNILAKDSGLSQPDLVICLGSTEPKDYRTKTQALANSVNLTAVPAMFMNNERIVPADTEEGWKTMLGI